MRCSDTKAAYAALCEADPDVMERDELAELTKHMADHRAWCDSLQVRITRRQRQLGAEGRAEAPRDLLSREGRQSSKDARTADERERVCSALPEFEDALAIGAVSAGHVDAIAQATRDLDQTTRAEFLALGEHLVTDAERMDVDVFGRSCRDLARLLSAAGPRASDVDELQRQREASSRHATDHAVTGTARRAESPRRQVWSVAA